MSNRECLLAKFQSLVIVRRVPNTVLLFAGATAVERGAKMWQALHGGAAAADHTAALQRFNSSLLAEAGILSESSWSLPVMSVAAVPGKVASEPQAAASASLATDAAESTSAELVSAELTDYVI